ncbi:MAG: family 20 glycosylhydrolase, partial [bacterium]
EKQLGFKLKTSDKAATNDKIVVGLATDPAAAAFAKSQGVYAADVITPEGYALSVGGNGILLAGADPDGTFYAVQTLRQMVRSERAGGGQLPKLLINDWPSFAFRGITDDISRGPVPTMDTIKQTLRRLSEFKINKFNFYLEHVFEFKKNPLIGPKGGSLTADQIREIDAYAKKYHIELVGGMQSFGHFGKILNIQKYTPLAESPFNPSVLSPANPKTYELLGEMYSEIAPPFSSHLFNISCDETWGLGEGQSRKMVAKIGIEGVYAYHIQKVHKLLAGQNKRVMMWADIALKHPGILEKLPLDLIFLPWAYDGRDNFDDMLKPIAATGHDFIVCPGASCWGRMFPNVSTARKNIGHFARDGQRYNAMGVLNTTWDDDGENLFGYNWYPLAWGAEVSWNPLNQDEKRFDDSFSQAFYGTPDSSVSKGIAQFEKVSLLTDFFDLSDGYYWSWPPTTRRPGEKMARVDAKNLIEYAQIAEKRFDEGEKSASANKDNFVFLKFAARRMQELGNRRLEYFRSASLYQKAYENQDADRAKVLEALATIDASLSPLQSGAKKIWSEYQLAWQKENRPYWLDMNEQKYKKLETGIESTLKSFRAAADAYKKGGRLPDNKEAGLPLPDAR